MPVRYDKLVPALKALLPEPGLNSLGRAVSFIRRLREINAGAFVWSVVLSRFGNGRPAFEQARHWLLRLTGSQLWPRPFQMRFKSPAAVRLFEGAFEHAVHGWKTTRRKGHPLTRHFPDVVAIDSTLLQVSDELKPFYKGTRAAKASLKALLTISVFGLLPLHAKLGPGNRHDMKLFPELENFRVGTLLLFDKGFVAYERLAAIAGAALHFLCPMRLNGNATIVRIHRAPKRIRAALKRSAGGVRLRDVLPIGKRIGQRWDVEVVLTSGNVKGRRPIQTRCRLVIVPGPKGTQRPYLTTLSRDTWAPRAIAELYRLRWQIELVFKELKQNLNFDHLNTKDPYAVQVLAWASLIALALSRSIAAWLCPTTGRAGLAQPMRPALLSRALRATIFLLAPALVGPLRASLAYLRAFALELQLQVRARDADREDSFKRLVPIMRHP
jgi:hypothetical protein